MSRSHSFCNNCGESGHAFHQCNKPITSTGIICYKHCRDSGQRRYLLIKRKDTLGFVEFMRGKYRQKDASYLRRLVDEMTLDEKSKIISLSFDKLWTGLWGEHVGQQYRGEHKDSYVKFQRLSSGLWGYKLKDIVAASKTTYVDTEWGLPKGRRNYQERDLTAALREFEEETGYPSQKLSLIANVSPLEECFTGSNLKSYKHLYFLAFQLSEASPQPFQASEVSDVRWFLLDEALAIIRPYNLEKKEVIQRADNILANYKVYH